MPQVGDDEKERTINVHDAWQWQWLRLAETTSHLRVSMCDRAGFIHFDAYAVDQQVDGEGFELTDPPESA